MNTLIISSSFSEKSRSFILCKAIHVALQEKGVPFYKLTKSGLLVALSIDELGNKKLVLDNFLSAFHPYESSIAPLCI